MQALQQRTYLRGIDFIQVPTSLLAQVDSSIGGKTGVDFRAYKNMVGAFHQPRLVYMNLSVLGSLSERLFNSGFGEIIKHGFIRDKEYYTWLKENIQHIKSHDYDALENMIAISCNIKRRVVELILQKKQTGHYLTLDIHLDMPLKSLRILSCIMENVLYLEWLRCWKSQGQDSL